MKEGSWERTASSPISSPSMSISPVQFTTFSQAIKDLGVNTVCESAVCPNRPHCFKGQCLAFLILGNTCTRHCRFCGVSKAIPSGIDHEEPRRIALAVKSLNLKYVVVTSVTRDDLPDGGAQVFVDTINHVRLLNPGVEIEVLIPDFNGNFSALDNVIDAGPDVINHNMEVVRRLFPAIRPEGNYGLSLKILNYIKLREPSIIVKSGIMVGVGESIAEIQETIKDIRENGADILTVGQYLAPDRGSWPASKQYAPEDFFQIESFASQLGFKAVFSGRNVRSSFHAAELKRALLQSKKLQKNTQ